MTARAYSRIAKHQAPPVAFLDPFDGNRQHCLISPVSGLSADDKSISFHAAKPKDLRSPVCELPERASHKRATLPPALRASPEVYGTDPVIDSKSKTPFS
jgi:hypothetical protein